MAAVADAIGLVGSVLGIWQFFSDNLPSQNKDASTYRIQVGLDGTDDGTGATLSNSGGNLEKIKTYNRNGELIGSGGGGNIDEGGYADFSAEQTGSQQSITTEFYAGNDAICIAYISATFDEGSQWGWVGDWGYACGLNWYPSGYELQSLNGDQKVDGPRCTWIDKDHSNDLKAGVIGITWPDFYHQADGPDPSGDGRNLCGSSMRAWDADGGNQLLSPGGMLKVRSNGPRASHRSDDRLVVSHRQSHNATELCESETSYGPDFVSVVEGAYCNMETHEVVPLCGKANGLSKDCFALDGPDGPAMVARNGKRSPKKATKVIEWN